MTKDDLARLKLQYKGRVGVTPRYTLALIERAEELEEINNKLRAQMKDMDKLLQYRSKRIKELSK